ncbi:uncharacterized protein J3R85_004617 [Psidium guajava]|nr:uncharacterized protein J3R85_004617 [Psidium guajava]
MRSEEEDGRGRNGGFLLGVPRYRHGQPRRPQVEAPLSWISKALDIAVQLGEFLRAAG